MEEHIPTIRLAYSSRAKYDAERTIGNSSDAYEFARRCFDSGTLELFEEFHVIYLDLKNQVLGTILLNRGNTDCTQVNVRLLLAIALVSNASGIIVVHNHPSGRIEPSIKDRQLTKQLVSAAELLSTKILDHLIVTKDSYYSFADEDEI